MKSVTLTLSYAEGGFHEIDKATRDISGISREQLVDMDKHSDGSCVLLYLLSGGNTDHLANVLDEHSAVIESVFLSENGAISLFVHLKPENPLTELLEIVERYALVLEMPISIDDDRMSVTVSGSEQMLQQSLEDIPDSVEVSVDRIADFTAGGHSIITLLTDRQREALETAIDMGYYERPRRTTYEELGVELDCSSSTANALLREAERRIMMSIKDR